MKLQNILIGAVLLVAGISFATWLVGSEAAPPDQRIADLLERIQKLEKRVDQLEQRPPMIAVPNPGALHYTPSPPPGFGVPNPSPPREWSQKEFNGSYYYIVPLNSMKDAAQQPKSK